MAHSSRRILAVVDDLFFIVKINDAAKRGGMLVEFLKSGQDLLDKALAEPPALVIVDLNCTSARPLPLISSLKRDGAFKGVSVIAFVSHVQGELKMQAQDAGADMVLARSAFSINLPQILRRHAA